MVSCCYLCNIYRLITITIYSKRLYSGVFFPRDRSRNKQIPRLFMRNYGGQTSDNISTAIGTIRATMPIAQDQQEDL